MVIALGVFESPEQHQDQPHHGHPPWGPVSKGAFVKQSKLMMVIAASAASVALLAGCSSGSSSSTSGEPKKITVAYETTASFNQMQNLMATAKKEFEASHPGVTVNLEPINAENADYYTKLALLDRSASTAPDVQYEDTFKIQADAAAGYLLPLDSYLSKWKDWSQFTGNAKLAGKGPDGKTYGVSLGTDTRALWYNKDLFKQAGLPTDWKPKTWADVIAAAKTIKAKLPGVIPINVYSGTPAGEASTMQGFEMLLYGTANQLTQGTKWVAGSKGFTDSLKFVQTIYQNGLGPSLSEALDPNIFTNVSNVWLPKGQLAIDLDGSWQSGSWITGGTAPWPAWTTTMGVTPFPTENGQAPGANSMSGGWTLAVGKHSKSPDLAVQFLETAENQKNELSYDIADSQVAVRKDVANDPKYASANPTFKFFSSLVALTHFRPATTPYTQVSTAIQTAMESVMTGQQSPAQATQVYGSALPGIVGASNVTKAAK
jgi:multiple sugar transport system substrate-binding protein